MAWTDASKSTLENLMKIRTDSNLYGTNATSIDVWIDPIYNYVDGKYWWDMEVLIYNTRKKRWDTEGIFYNGYVTQSSPSFRKIYLKDLIYSGSYIIRCHMYTQGRNGKWYKGRLQTTKFTVKRPKGYYNWFKY